MLVADVQLLFYSRRGRIRPLDLRQSQKDRPVPTLRWMLLGTHPDPTERHPGGSASTLVNPNDSHLRRHRCPPCHLDVFREGRGGTAAPQA